MTSPLARRLLVLGLSLVAALGVSLVVFPDAWSEVTRRLKRWRPAGLTEKEFVDEAAADVIFDLERIRNGFRFDPEAVLLPVPNREMTWRWDEHPDGKFTIRNNNMGFREDEPTQVEKTGYRILVAGDSHTQGAVNNTESYPNMMEAKWNADAGAGAYEVINAGVGYTGPYCYARLLEKYLYLQPDVFVAALFVGNDFWDDLLVAYTLDGERPPRGDAAVRKRLDAAVKRWPGMGAQGLNQAYRFKHWPEEKERSLQLVIESYERMHRTCRDNDIVFVALVIPTKLDVDPDDRPEEIREVLKASGLTLSELRVGSELGARFGEALYERGISVVDPTPRMLETSTPLYWRRDDHLSVDGHALVARMLYSWLGGKNFPQFLGR